MFLDASIKGFLQLLFKIEIKKNSQSFNQYFCVQTVSQSIEILPFKESIDERNQQMETLNREVDGFVEKQSSIGDEETKVEDEKHALIHGRAMMENKIKELEQLSNKQTTK